MSETRVNQLETTDWMVLERRRPVVLNPPPSRSTLLMLHWTAPWTTLVALWATERLTLLDDSVLVLPAVVDIDCESLRRMCWVTHEEVSVASELSSWMHRQLRRDVR